MTRVRALAGIGVAGAALILALPVWASAPTIGTGGGMVTSLVETSSRDAGGNRIAERTLEGFLTGAFTGTFVEHVRGVVHPNGTVTFHGTMVFTGTAAGCGSGTLTLGLSGRGAAGAAPQTEANVRPIDEASSTLTVRGAGTVSQNGPFLSYEVRYGC